MNKEKGKGVSMSVDKVMSNSPFAKMQQIAKPQTVNTQGVSVQTAPAAPAQQTKNKNVKKTPIVVSAIALAALGATAYVKRDKISQLIKNSSKQSTAKLQEKITKLKEKYRSEALRVLNENMNGTVVKIENIEPAAAIRSATPNLENKFHQAASWIEEAYLEGYSRADLKDGKNILNYIHTRIGSENNTLAQMYAQMPKEEAEVRLQQFATEAISKDSHTGMTPSEFIKDMWDVIIPKAKADLEALK